MAVKAHVIRPLRAVTISCGVIRAAPYRKKVTIATGLGHTMARVDDLAEAVRGFSDEQLRRKAC
jgi:hypothetical protein